MPFTPQYHTVKKLIVILMVCMVFCAPYSCSFQVSFVFQIVFGAVFIWVSRIVFAYSFGLLLYCGKHTLWIRTLYLVSSLLIYFGTVLGQLAVSFYTRYGLTLYPSFSVVIIWVVIFLCTAFIPIRLREMD